MGERVLSWSGNAESLGVRGILHVFKGILLTVEFFPEQPRGQIL